MSNKEIHIIETELCIIIGDKPAIWLKSNPDHDDRDRVDEAWDNVCGELAQQFSEMIHMFTVLCSDSIYIPQFSMSY